MRSASSIRESLGAMKQWLGSHPREAAFGVAAAVLGALVGIYLQARQGDQLRQSTRGPAMAQPAPAPVGNAGTQTTIITWSAPDGSNYRARVLAAPLREFLARERPVTAAGVDDFAARSRAATRDALVPIFEEVASRVPAFGTWTFDWWTS